MPMVFRVSKQIMNSITALAFMSNKLIFDNHFVFRGFLFLDLLCLFIFDLDFDLALLSHSSSLSSTLLSSAICCFFGFSTF